MKTVFFKTNDAVANYSGAMETETIQKNGAWLINRRSIFRKTFFALLATCCILFSGCRDPKDDANTGYDCVSGECVASFDHPQYLTLADCKSDCGNNNNTNNNNNNNNNGNNNGNDGNNNSDIFVGKWTGTVGIDGIMWNYLWEFKADGVCTQRRSNTNPLYGGTWNETATWRYESQSKTLITTVPNWNWEIISVSKDMWVGKRLHGSGPVITYTRVNEPDPLPAEGKEALYGTWVWRSFPSGENTARFVISENQLIYSADQPNSIYFNGAYTISILKWTAIQNTGTNKDTYPSGFRAEGVVIHKSGLVSSINIGDSHSFSFYLNSQKDKIALAAGTVFEKQ